MSLAIFLSLNYHYSISFPELYKKIPFIQQNNSEVTIITFFILV
jgi:hypothetical protein